MLYKKIIILILLLILILIYFYTKSIKYNLNRNLSKTISNCLKEFPKNQSYPNNDADFKKVCWKPLIYDRPKEASNKKESNKKESNKKESNKKENDINRRCRFKTI